jgi:hypothetical protein
MSASVFDSSAPLKRYFDLLVRQEHALRVATAKNPHLATVSLHIYKLSLLVTLSSSEQDTLLKDPTGELSNLFAATRADFTVAKDVFGGIKITRDRIDSFLKYASTRNDDSQPILEYSDVFPIFQLSQCTEYLLQSGGDDRLTLDSSTAEKTNKYFSSTVPRDEVIRRGSCTCTTINSTEYNYADSIRIRMLLAVLLRKNTYTSIFSEATENIRLQINRIVIENAVKTPSYMTSQNANYSSLADALEGPISPQGSNNNFDKLSSAVDDAAEGKASNEESSATAQLSAVGTKGMSQVMKTPVLNIGVSAVAGVVGSAYSVTSRLSTMAYDTSSRIVDVSKNTLTDITLLPVGVATDSINLISPSKKATAVKTAPRCQFSSVLFPSGTDAEYLPLLLALNRSCLLAEELYREKRVAPDDPNKVINPKVINIVVAAGEVGSGTAPACQGLHFSPQAPMGFAQKNAQPVFNCSSSSLSSTKMSSFDSKCAISVINHKLRLNISNPELDEINFFGSIRSLVAKEPAHAVIVLHVVVCSKTGLVYPSIAHVNELRRDYGNRVIVVVDACQFRVKLELISMYLNSNFIVLITGSKFFAGPPFRLACLQMV